MAAPATPIDPSPPSSAGGKNVSKIVLPPDEEQWLSTSLVHNPKPDDEMKARWVKHVQQRIPHYTMANLTQWMTAKRKSTTRMQNVIRKQRAAAEAEMESQIFPKMSEATKSELRRLYKSLNEPKRPSQSLMDVWASTVGISPTDVSRWVQWRHAMDDTERENNAYASSSGSMSTPRNVPVATPTPREPKATPTPVQTGAGSSSSAGPQKLPRPKHQVSLDYHQHPGQPQSAAQGQQANIVPQAPNARPRSFAVPKAPEAVGTGHPVPRIAPSDHPLSRRASGPVPVLPKPPNASRRPSAPNIPVSERGHAASASTGSAGPPKPRIGFPQYPQSFEGPDSSLLRADFGPTYERRRSHSPPRLSPVHRHNERVPRRQSPPLSSISPTTPVFRNSPRAGSPSASTSAPSTTGGRPPGESEPPLTPSPPPTAGGVLRYSPIISEASTSSRTVTSGPLAPLFTELAAGLHKAGVDFGAYPFVTSDLSMSSAPARRLSADGILRQLPRPNRAEIPPTPEQSSVPPQSRYRDWFSSSSVSERKLSESERFNSEIEARNAEMLRDMQSGSFAHLGLRAPSRATSPIVKREPGI